MIPEGLHLLYPHAPDTDAQGLLPSGDERPFERAGFPVPQASELVDAE